MTHHLEIEYKTLLNKDEFNRLGNYFSHIPPITQTNYYFDSENFDIKAHQMSLRIRTLPNRAELTLKIPKTVGNLEYNYDLDLEQAKTIVETGQFPEIELLDLIRKEGIDPNCLKSFGNLTTIRRETTTPIGLMALDSNQYSGIQDYELELEVEDAVQGKKDFDQFLREHDINFKYSKSKVARFSSTLKRN